MAVTARSMARDVWQARFRPRERISIVRWAEQHFHLSPEYTPGLLVPARFTFEKTPYLREILDSLADPDVPEVTWVKGAQVGGTTADLLFTAYTIDQRPQPMLIGWPGEKMLKAHAIKRLDPMIRDLPRLHGKFRRHGARRESSNSIESKQFAGGWIQQVTSKSAIQMRSLPSGWLVAEEVDEWVGDVGGQGDAIALLRARASTVAAYKFYKNSTPTVEGASRIWHEWDASSQALYHVPCPSCGAEQHLSWRTKDWPEQDGDYRLLFDRDSEGDVIPESIRYRCAACHRGIPETEKVAMLNAGRWIHGRPARRRFHAGYHTSQLETGLITWASVCRKFLTAKSDPLSLKTWVNTCLGLPFREEATEVKAHYLAHRAESYAAKVPDGVGVLTAGVDVQGDRLEALLWGWGHLEESWVIDWLRVEGDPGQDQVWQDLAGLLFGEWPHEAGLGIRVSAVAVDAAFMTERVHRFCDQWGHRNAFATVGRQGRGRPLLQAPDATKFKRTRAERRPVHVVGVDSAKDELLNGRLRITTTGARYIHFPETLDAVFYDQLTAERLQTVYVGRARWKRPERRWVKIEGRANEGLDLAVLNLAALAKLGPRVIPQLGALAEQIRQAGAGVARGGPATIPPPRTARPGRRVLSEGVT